MTVNEFSDGFNALLASYSLRPEFGDSYARQDIVLDEDEKGYFLTVAQDIVIRAAVDKAYNPNRQGADDSYARQADFAGLIKTTTSTTFPRDPLHILTEKYTVNNNVVYAVKPLTYEEYGRHLSKPYQKPLKRQVWRIQTGPNTVSIEPSNIGGEYSATYIARPKPIILVGDSAASRGTASSTSDLNETEPFHSEILIKAVELAVAAHRGVMVNGGQQR